MAGVPAAQAAEPDPRVVEAPVSAPNRNKGAGGVSASGAALAKAQRLDEPVEVVAERTETDTVFANPDGTLTREQALAPIRAADDEGELAPIDTTLRRRSGRLAPKVAGGQVSFTASGDGRLADYRVDESTRVGMDFDGVLEAPSVEGSAATYDVEGADGVAVRASAALEGFAADVILTEPPGQGGGEGSPEPEPAASAGSPSPVPGTETSPAPEPVESAVVEQAAVEPVEFRFPLTLEGVEVDLRGGQLVFSDADGEPVAQSRRLQMWDARVDEAGDPVERVDVAAELERGDAGTVLVLRPSMEFLMDPETVYPVTVDPDVGPTTPERDNYYFSGQQSWDPRGSDYRLIVGAKPGPERFRTHMEFSVEPYLGKTVTSATLELFQYYAGTSNPCQAEPMFVMAATQKAPATTLWSTQPSFSTDVRFRTKKTFNNDGGPNNGGPCPDRFEPIDVTQTVNAWAGGHVDTGEDLQGMVLRAEDENDPDQHKRFCSRNPSTTLAYCNHAGVIPRLSVTYAAETGSQSWYSTTDYRLNDRSQVRVNNDNGNLVVSASDVQVNARGLDMAFGRTYNSQSLERSSMGYGWSTSLGPDVWLEATSDYRIDYHTPSGAVLGSFVRNSGNPSSDAYDTFSTPTGGVNAGLVQDGDEYTLTFHGSETKYVFSDNAAGDDHAYLTNVVDRSGNEMTVSYAGATGDGVPKVEQITDAAGRRYDVAYGGDKITKISSTMAGGVGQRQWSYAYAGDYLTSSTDPSGAVTDYDYTPATSGPDLLTTITNPAQDSGVRAQTQISYGYNASIDVNEVTEVSRRHGTGSNETYDFTFDYNANLVDACDGNGDHSSVVTDPNAHETTYCFAERTETGDDATTWVYDALGNARSTEYSANNGPTNITTPTGQGTGPTGSTAIQYSDSFADRVDQVTEPKSDNAEEGVSAGLEYEVGGSVAGADYLPSAVRTSTRDCNRYGYDDAGRTTTAYTGITANADGTCGDESSADGQFHTDYNSDGTLAATWDANAGDNPTDADKTLYTYWQPGQTGFVAGTQGQVKTVRKPGGNCTSGVNRRLCTSYTYDGAARVASMIDGRGKKTSYAYDALDRTTAVYYNGTSEVHCIASGHSTCTTYDHDADGNLVQRSENGAVTDFTYDRLNRMTEQAMQAGTGLAVDVIAMAYDGVGNLTDYDQTVAGAAATHQVSYAYDEANQLATIDHPGEVIEFETDEDGRMSQVRFNSATNIAGDDLMVDYDYTRSGRPASMVAKRGGSGGETLANVDYDYTETVTVGGVSVEVDTSQLQTRDVSKGFTGAQEETISYDYDHQRLVEANSDSGPDFAYDYDKVGNIAKAVTDGATTFFGYDRAGQLCWSGSNDGDRLDRTCPSTPAGNTSFDHDAAGNSLGTSGDPIVVNDRNQVEQIDGIDQSHIDQGNDIRRFNGDEREVTGPLGVSATVDAAGDGTFLVRDPSGTLLARQSGPDNDQGEYVVSEPSGNTFGLFTTIGTIAASYAYAPYGELTHIDEAHLSQRFAYRWLGAAQLQTADGSDGAYKLGARYYETTGQFTQPDPLAGGMGDPRTLTRYNYAAGDPINQQDATGYFFSPFDLPGLVSVSSDIVSIAGACSGNAGLGGDATCTATFVGAATGLATGTICTAATGAAIPCGAAGILFGGAASLFSYGLSELLGVPD